MTTRQIEPGLIGFDIDGVIADTCEAFLRIAKDLYGNHSYSIEDITEFNVTECLPIPPAIIDSIFDALMKDPIGTDLSPMPHAVNVLTKMARKGAITIITARPLREPINDWLRHILPRETFSKTNLIAMGDHNGKGAYIKNEGIQFFVDDRAETCLSLDQEGITPLVFNQPWNKGKHSLATVDSWFSIEERLRL